MRVAIKQTGFFSLLVYLLDRSYQEARPDVDIKGSMHAGTPGVPVESNQRRCILENSTVDRFRSQSGNAVYFQSFQSL